MTIKSSTLIALCATLSFGAAWAQSEQPAAQEMPAQSATTPAAAIDDTKIEKFADAYTEVQTIQQKAVSEMQATADPAESERIQATAETDMVAAVENSGLDVDEFNQIVTSMSTDETVRARVAAKLQERQGGG